MRFHPLFKSLRPQAFFYSIWLQRLVKHVSIPCTTQMLFPTDCEGALNIFHVYPVTSVTRHLCSSLPYTQCCSHNQSFSILSFFASILLQRHTNHDFIPFLNHTPFILFFGTLMLQCGATCELITFRTVSPFYCSPQFCYSVVEHARAGLFPALSISVPTHLFHYFLPSRYCIDQHGKPSLFSPTSLFPRPSPLHAHSFSPSRTFLF